MIFNPSGFAGYIFPVALILLGLYLIFKRAGILPAKRTDDHPTDTIL